MATKLDMNFIRSIRDNSNKARHGFETLVNEVSRLECYCEALEKRLSPTDIA